MRSVAIRLKGIGKRYRIAPTPAAAWRGGLWQGDTWLGETLVRNHLTLREALTGALRSLGRMAVNRRAAGAGGADRTIWALKDVSLEIGEGEIVGIVGRNGAGKSSLLKVISRITEPTEGYAEVRGRLGSLLEVGTGFHVELTGRENVFLSGAILGMKRAEIARKFDEIVAFSEVEPFIDTPLKHYSTGMFLRLAFAVAAHLEPEILLVDEVLAVGDLQFQLKCLQKLREVAAKGRTVLLVSHNMQAITRLCTRAVLFEAGRVAADGPAPRVAAAYLSSGAGTSGVREWLDPASAPGGEAARLRAVRVRTEDGRIIDAVDVRESVALQMEYEVLKDGYVMLPSFDVCNEQGLVAFVTLDQDAVWRGRPRPRGRYVSTAWVPGNLLAEGTISVHAFLLLRTPAKEAPIGDHEFAVRDAVAFEVFDRVAGDSARADFEGDLGGVVRPLLKWTTQFSPNGDGSHGVDGPD